MPQNLGQLVWLEGNFSCSCIWASVSHWIDPASLAPAVCDSQAVGVVTPGQGAALSPPFEKTYQDAGE